MSKQTRLPDDPKPNDGTVYGFTGLAAKGLIGLVVVLAACAIRLCAPFPTDLTEPGKPHSPVEPASSYFKGSAPQS